MTAVQHARIAGFQAQAAQRGVSVSLLPDRGSFLALVEQYQGPQPGSVADSGPRLVDPDLRGAVRLAILRAEIGMFDVPVGSVFRDAANQTDYRVVRVERGGVDICDRFTCEREDVVVQMPPPPDPEPEPGIVVPPEDDGPGDSGGPGDPYV